MVDDDEEDDSGGVTATPYQCMASLVTLQQMRNRLHLAYTGRKLMKWTAMALGRELRKLAKALYDLYSTFRQEMRECYILLARARYANPNLNSVVLENVALEANIKAVLEGKSISGVKTTTLGIIDNEVDSYMHLGIGRGGETIAEAKEAWRRLLKKILFMCQQRISMVTLETAHRNAQRKKQLISKIVIPKLKATICYILSELEEKEREDTFRLKRFKQLKTKRAGKGAFCPKCACKLIKAKGEKHECPLCCPPPPKPGEEAVKVVDHLMNCFDIAVDAKNKKKEPVKPSVKRQPSEEKNPSVKRQPSEEQKTCVKRQPSKEQKPPEEQQPCKNVCKEGNVSPGRSTSKYSIKAPSKTSDKLPSNKSAADKELGIFENKFKEIVKVTRRRNPDGTITEEKHVITIRTEKRIPKKHDCYNIEARATKSEQNSCCDKMGEPTVRPCASSNREIVNRHRVPCSGSNSDLSIKSRRSRHSSSTEIKACGTMTEKTERSKMPGSSATSLSSRPGGKNVRKNSSCSCGTNPCPGKPSAKCSESKSNTVATNAATRDVATATSNLGKKSSNQKKTSFQIGAFTSCPSFSTQPRLEKLRLSSKSCAHDIKDKIETRKKLVLNPRLEENLKNIFRTPLSATYNKAMSEAGSKDSIDIVDGSMKANECQTDAESDEELEITQCNSCGSIRIRPCISASTSAYPRSKHKEKVRNLNELWDSKSSKSNKLDADDDDEDIRRDMAKTAKSFNSVCRLKQKRSSTCPSCPRDSCAACSFPNVKYKDASTNTRRSARYDVRGVASTPIRLQAKKKSTIELKSSACRSDNHIMKDKDKVRPIKPLSFLTDPNE